MNANENPNSWFTMVCAKPHIVLWAKVEGWNYWPVKMMSTEGSIVNVQFFGEHTEADVAVTKCFFYSEAYPSAKPPKKSNAYKLAKEVSVFFIFEIIFNKYLFLKSIFSFIISQGSRCVYKKHLRTF